MGSGDGVTDDFETGATGAGVATVGAPPRSVRAEWTLLGTFVDASFVGLDDLLRPLPLSSLLDEFSLAVLIRRNVLVRLIDWPTDTATATSLDASFSVVFDSAGERAGISMVAIDPRSKAPGSTLGESATASLRAHVAQASETMPGPPGGPAGEDQDAARSVASAMIALAGSLRDLSERYAPQRSEAKSDDVGESPPSSPPP